MANGKRKRSPSTPQTPSPYYRGVRSRTGSVSSGSSSIPGNQMARSSAGKKVIIVSPKNKYLSPGRKRSRRVPVLTRSKSAGFFKKGRRSAAKKRYAYAKYGFNKTLEAGGLSTTLEQTYYIGHGTMPQEEVAGGIAWAVTKSFLYKINKLKSDWDETLDFPAGAVVEIIFKANYQNPTVTSATISTGPITATNLAIAFRNFITDNLFDASPDTDFYGNQGRLMRMIYTPAAGYTETLLLENAKIRFNVKSTMKIQNRTRDSEGSDSTDVIDNSPLYGKSYTGSGTGTAYAGGLNNPDLVVDSSFGLIDQPAATNSTQEPPIGKLFQDVKTLGKAHLDPGEIKTSVLNSSGQMFLNTMLHMIGSKQLGASKKFKGRLGAFRFFALEKMIDSIGTEIARRIDIAWEHNLNQSYMLLPGTQLLTTSVFDKHYKA